MIIDDRLPLKRNNYVYARCSDPDEFWVALIEKAFAKLHGCYEAIEGGMPIESMVDLTGGLAERYELNNPSMHPTLYKLVLNNHIDLSKHKQYIRSFQYKYCKSI